jgi:LmbE family N-acetylglucosaminyl deacetylase
MPRTLLAFHAHPDDEALLTSGTLARAAAEGHRVVLVVATDGDEGLASAEFTSDGRLGERRWEELRESARALGVKRVEHLGYADSGLGPQTLPDPPGRVRFVRADVEEAAGRLATILGEERADVLLTYDRNGGYGHRDHVKVHQVGARAAVLAQTPRVLQATVPRDTIPPGFDPTSFQRAFSPRSEITHRIGVRRHLRAKRASMRAHASQASADGGADRTLAAFLRIPRPLFDLVFGREWYVDPAHPPGAPVSRDVFADLA